MKEDNKAKKQLVHELTELSSQNAARKKLTTRSMSAELAVEEALRYAESIVETVREPLLVLDADLKIISANRNFYRTFKVDPGETIGSFIYNLGDKQWDIPKLRELLEVVLPEKEAFDDFEVAHDFQDIGHKIMLLNARRIYRKDIEAKLILLAIEDITERKRLEDLLTESEEHYRHLFETASDGIVLLEKREGKITHFNPATEKMLGYTKEESIGNKLQDIGIFDIDDFQTIMQNLNKSGIINYCDVPVKTKSGQHIHTDIYLVDRAKLVQCNIRDITERKRAEKALRESESKYHNIFANAIVGIYQSTPEGRFITVNAAFARMAGYDSPEELIESIEDIGTQLYVHPEDRDRFAEIMATRGMVENFEVEFYRKDGSVFRVVNNSYAVKDDQGKILCYEGIDEDITLRKQAEGKLQQTMDNLRKSFRTTVQVLASAVESRDPYTAGHQIRSANLARAMATEMGLSQDRVDGIRLAGSIHDIGKLSIPAEILSKPTKLSELEFRLIQEHSLQGYEILKDVESPWLLAEIVHQHHERMDGSGYPRHLKGEEICMEARILAIADVVESMASHRPYRAALGLKAALEEIENNKGILYDADAVDACLRLFREKGFQFEGA